MNNIVLDTNIILRHPKVLGLQIPDIAFLVPIDVIEELNFRANSRGASFDRRVDLIQNAENQGLVSIVNTDAPAYHKHKKQIVSNKLSNADAAILSVAIELKRKGERVEIATLDKEIWKAAALYDIGILSEEGLVKLLLEFKAPPIESETIQSDIANYERKEKNNFWKGILIGILASLAGSIVYSNLQNIISTINVWGTIIVIIIIGVGLFVFREYNKFSYGVFEFFVGIIVIIVLFKPSGFDYSKIKFEIDFNVKILGGLYIMVRGQDNIVKGLKDTKTGLILKDKYGIGL